VFDDQGIVRGIDSGFRLRQEEIRKVKEAYKKYVGSELTGDRADFLASHAEKLIAVLHPNRPIGVSKELCKDCVTFFKGLARQGEQIIAGPKIVYIFEPIGTGSARIRLLFPEVVP
jgi:hypothetical protein